ncbi:hypothetical protein FGRMN_7936 [Fusarium graminum]|nr:hypothetical protein FGRMN_7936 [Fusarium graminum]
MKLSGVVLIEPQATTAFCIRKVINRPQFMLYSPIPDGHYLHPIALYPKEDSDDLKALEVVLGPRLKHLLACPEHFCSWASLEQMSHVSVYGGSNGGFLGMHIPYKNGGKRFVGIVDHMGLLQESAYCKEPAELNIEVTSHQSGADGPAKLVYFSPPLHTPHPDSQNTQYPIEGERHCWPRTGARPELRVLRGAGKAIIYGTRKGILSSRILQN